MTINAVAINGIFNIQELNLDSSKPFEIDDVELPFQNASLKDFVPISLSFLEEPVEALLINAETLFKNSPSEAAISAFCRELEISSFTGKWDLIKDHLKTSKEDVIPLLKAAFFLLAEGFSFTDGEFRCLFTIDGKRSSISLPILKEQEEIALLKYKPLLQKIALSNDLQELMKDLCPRKLENVLPFFEQLKKVNPYIPEGLYGRIVKDAILTLTSSFKGNLDRLPPSLWQLLSSLLLIKEPQLQAWKNVFILFLEDSSRTSKEMLDFVDSLFNQIQLIRKDVVFSEEENVIWSFYKLSQSKKPLSVKENPLLEVLKLDESIVRKNTPLLNLKGEDPLHLEANLPTLLRKGHIDEAINLLHLQLSVNWTPELHSKSLAFFYNEGKPSQKDERLARYLNFIGQISRKLDDQTHFEIDLVTYAFLYNRLQDIVSIEQNLFIQRDNLILFNQLLQKNEQLKKDLRIALMCRIRRLLEEPSIKPIPICKLLKHISCLPGNESFISNSLIALLTNVSEEKKKLVVGKIKEIFSEDQKVQSLCFSHLLKVMDEDEKMGEFFELFFNGASSQDRISLAGKSLQYLSKFSEKPLYEKYERLFKASIQTILDFQKLLQNRLSINSLAKCFELISSEEIGSKEEFAEMIYSSLSDVEFSTEEGLACVEKIFPYLQNESKEKCIERALKKINRSLEDSVPYLSFLLKGDLVSFNVKANCLFLHLINHLEGLYRLSISQSRNFKEERLSKEAQFIFKRLEAVAPDLFTKKEQAVLAIKCLDIFPENGSLAAQLFTKLMRTASDFTSFKGIEGDVKKLLKGLEFLETGTVEMFQKFEEFIGFISLRNRDKALFAYSICKLSLKTSCIAPFFKKLIESASLESLNSLEWGGQTCLKGLELLEGSPLEIIRKYETVILLEMKNFYHKFLSDSISDGKKALSLWKDFKIESLSDEGRLRFDLLKEDCLGFLHEGKLGFLIDKCLKSLKGPEKNPLIFSLFIEFIKNSSFATLKKINWTQEKFTEIFEVLRGTSEEVRMIYEDFVLYFYGTSPSEIRKMYPDISIQPEFDKELNRILEVRNQVSSVDLFNKLGDLLETSSNKDLTYRAFLAVIGSCLYGFSAREINLGLMSKVKEIFKMSESLDLSEETQTTLKLMTFIYESQNDLGNRGIAIQQVKDFSSSCLMRYARSILELLPLQREAFMRGLLARGPSNDVLKILNTYLFYLIEDSKHHKLEDLFCSIGRFILINTRFCSLKTVYSSFSVIKMLIQTSKVENQEVAFQLIKEIHSNRLKKEGISENTGLDLFIYLEFLNALNCKGSLRKYIEENDLYFDDETIKTAVSTYDSNMNSTKIALNMTYVVGVSLLKNNRLKDIPWIQETLEGLKSRGYFV